VALSRARHAIVIAVPLVLLVRLHAADIPGSKDHGLHRTGLHRTPTAQLPTADEVVLKNLNARGGIEKLKAITTIKQTATMSMQGRDAAMTIYSKRPNLIRQEVYVGGQLVVNGFDGTTPWILNPNAPQPLIIITGPQAEQIRSQTAFDGPLMDYKALGTTVSVEGFEVMGSTRVMHLRLTTSAGRRSDLYLDAETWLDARLSTQDNRTRVDQELSDYRDVDGIKTPFHVRTLTNGVLQSELKVQSVDFHATIADSLFKVPKGS
jgi:hypothetical protein